MSLGPPAALTDAHVSRFRAPFCSYGGTRLASAHYPDFCIYLPGLGALSGLGVMLAVAPQWPVGVRHLTSLLGALLRLRLQLPRREHRVPSAAV